ncbi:phage Gp37/Gp68 family protein [Chromobacterium sp. S0633]|uniref:phage Gp37/Gp68 family protein n=1 Tax=Chromobacterium sp. S0633 TaxID=2957805 RepID=UPI00209DF628|nr:phage Gp37/Gp68 family protein [Chromobacterium sp. S0633]MCP1289861.1 phage Gp37/Gp68 family protein [Chromobacterium sp. S0633]
MAENSKIEWTHHTFNPWWGCAKVSPACDNCYAERDANRFTPNSELWGALASRREFGDKHWNAPLAWNRKAQAEGVRHRVFSASMADVFDKNAPDGARERLFELIKATPHLDWLLLTKRIGNATKMLPADWGDGYPNVWLGISVVNQEEADRDTPKLLNTPAALRWLSMEPLLGQVDLAQAGALWSDMNGQIIDAAARGLRGIDWVVVGGESGPNARPMLPEWARALRDQCAAAGAPFLFKQWGEWAPYDRSRTEGTVLTTPFSLDHPMQRIGKKLAGRLLDGVQYDGYPATKGCTPHNNRTTI